MLCSKRARLAVVLFFLGAVSAALPCSAGGPPQVRDQRLKLELFAEQPDIVTPIGAVFDHQGRLLVIESHTHQRGGGYKGPEKDRIRIVEDTDGAGCTSLQVLNGVPTYAIITCP